MDRRQARSRPEKPRRKVTGRTGSGETVDLPTSQAGNPPTNLASILPTNLAGVIARSIRLDRQVYGITDLHSDQSTKGIQATSKGETLSTTMMPETFRETAEGAGKDDHMSAPTLTSETEDNSVQSSEGEREKKCPLRNQMESTRKLVLDGGFK